MEHKKERKLVWVDCDPGHDDLSALIMILSDPTLEVIGASSSNGNVDAAQGAINMLNIFKLFKKDQTIKVFHGAETSIKRPQFKKSFFHGKSGLDGVEIEPS